MAGCINMPLGMEVGLSPGDNVLEGDPASSPSPFCMMARWKVHVELLLSVIELVLLSLAVEAADFSSFIVEIVQKTTNIGTFNPY